MVVPPENKRGGYLKNRLFSISGSDGTVIHETNCFYLKLRNFGSFYDSVVTMKRSQLFRIYINRFPTHTYPFSYSFTFCYFISLHFTAKNPNQAPW